MKKSEDVSTHLRDKGARVSLSREGILSVLGGVSRPLSVADILERLFMRGKSFNKTTIYREVETLKKEGRIKEIFFRNDTALYELIGEHHHHLVCISCGDVRDVFLKESLEQEENRLAKKERFTIFDHSLEFFGRCQKCQ